MANSMNRDLTGCVVLIAAQYLKPEYQEEEARRFRVWGGFGAQPHTAGNALFGTFVANGLEARMEGYMVERLVEEPPAADLAPEEEHFRDENYHPGPPPDDADTES